MRRKTPAAPAVPAGPDASKAKPPKGTRRTTPSPETLAALGRDRLVGLILGETARNPAFRKLVSAALAALQGPEAVAAIVDRRLTALEGARGFVDWQKRRTFTADLDASVTVILAELAPLDRASALERLVRFLDGAAAVLGRVDDASGAVQAVYERASDAVAALAGDLGAVEAARFVSTLLPRFVADPYGPFGPLIDDLVARLPADALDPIDAGLAAAAGPSRGVGTDDRAGRAAELHRARILRLRQTIADRRGDVDAFVGLEREIAPGRPDGIEIGRRLLDAGRAAEALAWVRRPAKASVRVVTYAMLAAGVDGLDGRERERIELEVRILDALGRRDEAQALRRHGFETLLDAGLLRAHIARLPDFEDEEAVERALDHVARHDDAHRALAFLVAWPSPHRAARLVLARHAEWRGDAYRLLGDAAEALEPAHPAAATLLLRRLIDDVLRHGRSGAYAHAARHLATLDAIAPRLDPGSVDPTPDAYRAALRKAHGRKHGFWSLVRD